MANQVSGEVKRAFRVSSAGWQDKDAGGVGSSGEKSAKRVEKGGTPVDNYVDSVDNFREKPRF